LYDVIRKAARSLAAFLFVAYNRLNLAFASAARQITGQTSKSGLMATYGPMIRDEASIEGLSKYPA
jgi:hypothetical protein